MRDFFDGGAWGVLLLAELLADEDLLRLGGIEREGKLREVVSTWAWL